MNVDLDNLERLHREATPGEWWRSGWQIIHGEREASTEVAECDDPADADLIVAMRNDLPELIRLARLGQRYDSHLISVPALGSNWEVCGECGQPATMLTGGLHYCNRCQP